MKPADVCRRLLFFHEPVITLADLVDVKVRDSFAGFMTIWPTSPPVIGRTVLPFPDADDDAITVAADAEYHAHLAGWKLSLRAAMYARKDHAVSACATIAMWSALDVMHQRFGLNTCSTTELTLLASGHEPGLGHPFPHRLGLTLEQTAHAMHRLDYDPFMQAFNPALKLPVETMNLRAPLVYVAVLGHSRSVAWHGDCPFSGGIPGDGDCRLIPRGTPK